MVETFARTGMHNHLIKSETLKPANGKLKHTRKGKSINFTDRKQGLDAHRIGLDKKSCPVMHQWVSHRG